MTAKCILSIITSPCVGGSSLPDMHVTFAFSVFPQHHTEIALLRCKVKELEAAASDAGYFAMMYRVSTSAGVSANSGEATKEPTKL